MFFAAKIQKDTVLQFSELQPKLKKDLCLTNFSLSECESMAGIYLTTKEAADLLIVCLEKPHLSAYHTSITLSHKELAHSKIQSRYGDVFIIGRWIDVQQSSEKLQNKIGRVVESQTQRKSFQQEKKQIKANNNHKNNQKLSQKRKQQQSPGQVQQPLRQSSRVRTVSTSQAAPAPVGKKSSSSSKGKSLLDMMNNLDEEDDEQSSYSEQDDDSDDSDDSSSEESPSEQQDDRKTKRQIITEKRRRRSIPIATKGKQRAQNKENSKKDKKSQKQNSSEESQEKPKDEDEANEQQAPIISLSCKKNEQNQSKPFSYVIPTRLPDFLQKK